MARRPARPTAQSLAQLAGSLAIVVDPHRLATLFLLAEGERYVEVLREAMGTTSSTASFHLARLRAAGLVESRADGARRIYTITPAGRSLVDAVGKLAAAGGGS
jgi:DNA-binding transcriptional ArsR family regulator